MANILAAANGNWTDTASWTGGVIPGVGDTAVMNGKTLTLNSGESIHCDLITNDSALGLANGGVSLVIVPNTVHTFTVTANLSMFGTTDGVGKSIITPSMNPNGTTVVNLITTGAIRNESTASTSTIYFSVSTATGIVNFVHTGDIYCAYTTNSAGITFNGSYATGSVVINGNILSPLAVMMGSAIRMNPTSMSVVINGNVDIGNNTSSGAVMVSTPPEPSIFVLNGVITVPAEGGKGRAMTITAPQIQIGSTGYTGTLVPRGNGSSAVTLISSTSNVLGVITLNGNIYGQSSNISVSITTSGSSTWDLTLNGNIIAAVAPNLCPNTVVTLDGSKAALTVNGEIDGRQLSGNNSTATLRINWAAGSGDMIFNGAIRGSTLGFTVTSLGCVWFYATTGYSGAIVFNAPIYAGTQQAGVYRGTSTEANELVILSDLIGGTFPAAGALSPRPAVSGLTALKTELTGVIDLTTGSVPFERLTNVVMTSSAVLRYWKTVNGTVYNSNINQGSAIIPDPADVREGVAVGDGLGTLVTSGTDLTTVATALSGLQADVTTTKNLVNTVRNLVVAG